MRRDRALSPLSPRSPAMIGLVMFVGMSLEFGFGESWGIYGLLGTVTGVLGISYTVWCWLGRSLQARSWPFLLFGADIAMLFIPFFAFAMLAIGSHVFFGIPRSVALVIASISGVHLIIAFLGLGKCPRWWGPGWYRRGEFSEPGWSGEVPWDALGALRVSMAVTPEVLSTDKLREDFAAGAEPEAKWKGGWVHDADTDGRAHPLARKGTVEGTVAWFEQGVGFAASRREDALRGGESTVVTIPAKEITGASTVPARAGVDGIPRRGWRYRSFSSRLVVHTVRGPYLFDVARGRARRVAAMIEEQVHQPT